MTAFQIGIYIFLVFIAVYAVVDRVCKCIEHKHLSNAFSSIADKSKNVKVIEEELNKYIL